MSPIRRKRLLQASLVSAVILAGAAQAAELTLYKQPNFTGPQLTLRGYTPNLSNTGFVDQASSLAISSGRWELCTQPDFKGECVTLGPGEYPALDPRLNHRIESARDVGSYQGQTGAYNRYGRGSIDLFGQPGFGGRTLQLDRDTPSLEGSGFNDRASSVVVNEGTWQLCSDAGFEGTCRVYAPGRYADLGYGMAKNISSARLLRSSRDAPAVLGGGVSAPEFPSNEGTSRVILFSDPNFRGESMAVSGVNGSLDRAGFDDAASMVIEGGRWLFCTEPYFRGDCRVIGPGRYGNLREVGLSRGISSIRPAGSDAGPPSSPAPTADIELFRSANFDGGGFGTRRDVPRLGGDFNDKISSAIVSAGRWELCTDADYGGRCIVVGPGRYRDLGGLDNQISSLRRIR